VKRRLRSGAPIPRNRAPGRDNRARRGRGTEGSNPSPSSGESTANLTSSIRAPKTNIAWNP
jgi:hypothetical protein